MSAEKQGPAAKSKGRKPPDGGSLRRARHQTVNVGTSANHSLVLSPELKVGGH
eukprot:CAMPEP_0118892032 /NCGR_PEP_ID=MMETSP1166-20130328/1793_1 /TAXON_ID=1104430 /ORGANISM="Chrysoreinhardia sp, Strain CCMP3193" /LENGTH=52 /DNA_ID=CAMNT_0006830723 /DNA_START=101 /DNA_END=259 /DNA_ORIENTATION=-